MSRIIDIEQRMKRMQKLEEEIERSKELINIALGEELMKGLGLEYGKLTSKKEVTELAQKIQENLPPDFLKDKEPTLEENKEQSHQNTPHDNHSQQVRSEF